MENDLLPCVKTKYLFALRGLQDLLPTFGIAFLFAGVVDALEFNLRESMWVLPLALALGCPDMRFLLSTHVAQVA